MTAPGLLTTEMANTIYSTVELRQARFDETLHTSLMVVLLNYGDELTGVSCIGGDWEGTKAEAVKAPSGLPCCPVDGRPLLESAKRWRLGLMPDTPLAEHEADADEVLR